MNKVKLTKIVSSGEPAYIIVGILLNKIQLGESVKIYKGASEKNQVGNMFTSSLVTEITKDGFKTLNSIYKMEYVE